VSSHESERHTAAFTSNDTAKSVETQAAVYRAHVLVANFSDDPLTIPKSTVIGVAEPVSETLVNLVNSGEQTVAKLRTVPRRKKENVKLYSKLLRGKMDHLSQEE